MLKQASSKKPYRFKSQIKTNIQNFPEITNDRPMLCRKMFLRFQTKIKNDKSETPIGFLVAAHDLRDSGNLEKTDEEWLRKLLGYFNMHLKIPSCLTEHENRRAVSWFKSNSSMIDRVWELVAFLEEKDIYVDILRSDDPGSIIIYEDRHQVVVKPHRKATKP